ncbi:MAG TPA: SpoIIE family protein phosphatase [Candidatus Thermoplasmatota archaeon]|nr:SpoIIE family protein phosphatase [Candidatus Thermoplasmatota archaeon]
MKCYAITDKGGKEQNEDSFIAEKIGSFYVFGIADGVGGLSFGEIASKQAIETLRKNIQDKETIDLKEEFEKANQSVLFEGDKRKTGMATTLVAAVLQESTGKSTIAHVGDSRAYIIDDNIWKTKDHTIVQDHANGGAVLDEDSFSNPERHPIQKALGVKNRIDIEVNRKLAKDSILLLCSDGLSDFVRDGELAAIARQYDPETACKKLIQKARENGSTDDITVIIAHVTDGD